MAPTSSILAARPPVPRPGPGPGPARRTRRARGAPGVGRVARAVAVPVSIDTYKAEVAERAIAAGARLVNDVWGLRRDPQMAGAVSRAGVPMVLMHNKP